MARLISKDGSNLSLVTIDIVERQTQARDTKGTIVLDHAPLSVTEAILDRELPNLPSEDRRRLNLFSEGFPGIATALARSWAESRPVAHSIEDHFADTYVKGRDDPEPETALKSAMLLAAFGHIDLDERASDQLDEIASRGRNLSARDLRAAIVKMVDRGVAQQQGRLVVLQPRPVAMKLTERQWNEWSPQEWCELLVGNGSPSLKRQIARQLAWLNTTSVSNRVLEEICHRKGHFNTLGAFSQPGQEEVLRALAAIDAQAVAEQIECALESVVDLSEIGGSLRRLLVGTLERIAFCAETFDTGARLLLRLAAAENELALRNNATGQFTALFPVVGGSTAADGNARLALLDEEVDTSNISRRTVAAKGLIAGFNTGTIFRFVGAETHGSRPALRSWRPANPKEAQDYVVSCVLRVAAIAKADDEIGLFARTELGHELRRLVSVGLIDTLETVIPKLAVIHNDWTRAIESLGNVLEFDVTDEDTETAKRIQALLDLLAPKTDAARVRFLVTEMPWDYPNGEKLDFAERDSRQIQAVKDLALELAEKPSVLAEVLPQICVGTQRWANLFGQSIAKTVPSAHEWLNQIVSASLSVTKPERNFEFLVGYIVGLADDHPDIVEAFKGFAARSPDLAPTLPSVSALLGVTSTDVDLAIEALKDGVLHPEFLNQWALGRAIEDVPASTVATLIDSMLDHSEVAFSVSLLLLSMYSHDGRERLEDLRPQVRKVAETLTRWELPRVGSSIAHHFKNIVMWMLEKGREDKDARSVALSLARTLANPNNKGHANDIIKGVVPILLARFPEIVWPLLGQAIESNPHHAWRLHFLLRGSGRLGGDRKPPLLSLPEDTLFAWCHAYPESAPEFVAEVLPILAAQQANLPERELHPILIRLLDDFGDRSDVLQAVERNLHSFGWVGSVGPYYARYVKPVRTLAGHRHRKVSRWATRMLRALDAEIREAEYSDQEIRVHQEV